MYHAKIVGSEYHARRASEEVKRLFAGDAVLKPAEYWTIVRRNRGMLISIVDEHNRMRGFFDVFPLKNRVAQAFLRGRLSERSLLSPEGICSPRQAASSKYIYLGTILAFNATSRAAKLSLEYSMIKPLLKYLKDRYPAKSGRIYFALASTRLGEKWIRACRFNAKTTLSFYGHTRVIYEFRATKTNVKRLGAATNATKGPRGRKPIPIRCTWGRSLLQGRMPNQEEPKASPEESCR